jgi:hypothetical protein
MVAIVATCEHCAGYWLVAEDSVAPYDPDVLEGVCMDCQEDSEVERPLAFRWWGGDYDMEHRGPEETLPEEWLL